MTGARDSVADSAAELAARVRRTTDRPLALGFGVSRPEHVRAIGAYADAAVVGSALGSVLEEAQRLRALPREDGPAAVHEGVARHLDGHRFDAEFTLARAAGIQSSTDMLAIAAATAESQSLPARQ